LRQRISVSRGLRAARQQQTQEDENTM
jgi:hypothetical protein